MNRRRWILLSVCVVVVVTCLCWVVMESLHHTQMARRRQMAEAYVDDQLESPSVIAGQSADSEFITQGWIPGLQKAKAHLNDLESGRMKTLPLTAFIRYVGNSYYLVGVFWHQSDEGLREIILLDGDREVVRFDSTTAEPERHLSFFQADLINVLTKLANMSDVPHTTTRRKYARLFDANALGRLRVRIEQPGKSSKTDSADTIRVITISASEKGAAEKGLGKRDTGQ